MTETQIAVPKHRRSIVFAYGLMWLCAFSRPPSTALDFPRSLTLAVSDTQVRVQYDPRTESDVSHRSNSVITYFGRVEDEGEKDPVAVTAYNDSIRFRGVAPFRFDTFMSRDTMVTISKENESVIQNGATKADREMLDCLFDGPSLRVSFPEEGGTAAIEHMKTQCPGGIYKRLDLPRTLGVFVLRIPSGKREIGDGWTVTRSCPSYSGLGLFPDLSVACRIADVDEDGTTVQITCDTTFTNVRVVTPDGEKASVIQGWISVAGSLTISGRTGICRHGEVLIMEKTHFVRGDSSSDVLRNECEYRLTLTSP